MEEIEVLKLPEPVYASNTSIEEAIQRRRSTRRYKDDALTLKDVSQLLWAGQGITRLEKGYRAAPSAGAMYPLDLYVVAGNVEGLDAGVYRYGPSDHTITKTMTGDVRSELTEACLNQRMIERGAFTVVFTAIYERTTGRYGDRGIRYVHIDIGHAAENIYLQAVSMGLGTVAMGAFDDPAVKRILNLPPEEEPLYLMPVGRVKV